MFRRHRWNNLSICLLMLTSCAQVLHPPDSKKEAAERWGKVRARLKCQLAEDEFNSGRLEDAARSVHEAINLDPSGQATHLLLTRIQLERGETAMAAQTLEKALELGAETAETDYLNGLIAERYSRFEDALKWYQSASERDNLNAHYVVATAETLVTLDRSAEALALVQKRWTDFEQNATLRALAGSIFLLMGRYEEAAEAYRQAVAIAPADSTLKTNMGSALALAKHYDEAEQVLGTTTKSQKDIPPSILLTLGQSQLAMQHFDAAKRTLQRATAADNANPRAWHALARAALVSGDLMTARRAISEAMQLEPQRTDHQLLFAYICYQQEDFAGSAMALERVVQDDPKEAMGLCLLGRSREKLGDTDRARACYRQALSADPMCEWAKVLMKDKADASEKLPAGFYPGGNPRSP